LNQAKVIITFYPGFYSSGSLYHPPFQLPAATRPLGLPPLSQHPHLNTLHFHVPITQTIKNAITGFTGGKSTHNGAS
jgi:hypothetical protein